MPRQKSKGNKSGSRNRGGGWSPTSNRPDPPPNAWIAKTFPELTSSKLNYYVSTSEREGIYEYFSDAVRQYSMENYLIKPFVSFLTLLTAALYIYYVITDPKHNQVDLLEAMIAVYRYAYTPVINWAAFMFDIHPRDALYGEIKNAAGYIIGLPLLFYLLWRIRAIAVHRARTHPAGINCASTCFGAHVFLLNIILFGVAVSAALPKIIQFITFVAPLIPSKDPSRPTHPFWRNFMDAEKFESVKSSCWLFFNFFTAGAVLYNRFAMYSHWREVGRDFAAKLRISNKRWREQLGFSHNAEMVMYVILLVLVRVNLFTVAWAAFYPDISEFFESICMNFPE